MLSSVVPREFAYSIISTHFTILFVCCSILRRDNSVMFTFFVNFLFILVICLFNATLLQRDIMQIYWSQQSVYTPLNVLGVTACLFLTVRNDSPTPPLFYPLWLAWSPPSRLLPLLHWPTTSTAHVKSVYDWLAGLWCCYLSFRSSLDCSDRFFNENWAAVVLQHVWLSSGNSLYYILQNIVIFSLSESIHRTYCSSFTVISQHINWAFYHHFIHDPSRLICSSLIFPVISRPHITKKEE